jgi:hypothetical protein
MLDVALAPDVFVQVKVNVVEEVMLEIDSDPDVGSGPDHPYPPEAVQEATFEDADHLKATDAPLAIVKGPDESWSMAPVEGL